jgi:hypothetical protein
MSKTESGSEWVKESVNGETQTPRSSVAFGDIYINDKVYKIGFRSAETSRPETFNEMLYKHISKVGCASIVSMYLGDFNVNNIAITTVAYLFGERLFPILVSNYTMKYVYQLTF